MPPALFALRFQSPLDAFLRQSGLAVPTRFWPFRLLEHLGVIHQRPLRRPLVPVDLEPRYHLDAVCQIEPVEQPHPQTGS